MTLDKANNKLNEICQQIQKEDNLQKCMDLYSEAVELAQFCLEQTKVAHGKLTILNAKVEELEND
ncbi:MAG: hypothetical protein IJF72_05195 [Clostridia bacterium]|nr:hypothetical protein [Clostridia bacterium]